jgi:hypothetical protein
MSYLILEVEFNHGKLRRLGNNRGADVAQSESDEKINKKQKNPGSLPR